MNIRILFSIFVLTVALTLGAIPASAQQQSGVEGATAGLDLISGTALDELAFSIVTIPNTGSTWHCVATCSAEVRIISGIDIDGRLALVHEASEVAGTDRKFELNDNPGVNDPEVKEVSTTGKVANLAAGSHRLSCRAAKVATADPNFNISDSSITVSCSDNHL
jgi:hypothetical protein